MKIQWDSTRNYQNDAVTAVIDLFMGSSPMLHYFAFKNYFGIYRDQGIGNIMDILNEDILNNLQWVQTINKLPLSKSLDPLNFDIQMAKGTGKTYVYLKTIFELNKCYNFTKFTIVVSNRVQANYVKNFIDDVNEHFKELYDNVLFDYFVYDSSKLEQIVDFARNSNIQIMIITIDSFNSKNNIIHRKQDRLGGYKSIDLIAETNPIVIVDDFDVNDDKISNLNPLFTLRCASNFRNVHNLIYKFDTIEMI